MLPTRRRTVDLQSSSTFRKEGRSSSLDSQELMENALQNIIVDSVRRRGCCQGEPITEAGKRRQIAKVMSLLLAPMIALLIISSYFVAETVLINRNTEATRGIIMFSVELGEVLRMLQLERDQSVLYLSNIGPATKTFLLKQYLETNDYIYRLSMWPQELEANTKEYVRSRKAFIRHLTEHRNMLDLGHYTVFDEIYFYNGIIQVFHNWLYHILDESRYSNMWKTLVAYQKIIFARLYLGVERALGVYFFSKGGFVHKGTYEWYNEGLNLFRHSFKRAQNFSKLVKPIHHYDMAMISGQNLSKTIDNFRHHIQYQNMTHPSLAEARYWFDNMTSFLDIIFNIQTELADDILGLVNDKQGGTVVTLVISILLVVVVVGMVPLLIQALQRTTSNIQSYAITLAHKTKQLGRERAKTDTLLHQMLPMQVAKELKEGSADRAKYYRSVTLFCSDLVGLTDAFSQAHPKELVASLNNLYDQMDHRIDQYDVYKLESMGDYYMLASGLSSKNGNNHACELATMALELLDNIVIPPSPSGDRFKMRIGLHTGPVVAGIVRSKLPRYSLLGATVEKAARMQSTGIGAKIHISSDTHNLLDADGGFKMVCRGKINLDSEGTQTTYWLLGTQATTIPRSMRNKNVASAPNAWFLSTLDPNSEGTSTSDESFKEVSITVIDAPPSPTISEAEESSRHVGRRLELDLMPASAAPTPMSMDEVAEIFRHKDEQDSPPILQLVEGFHY